MINVICAISFMINIGGVGWQVKGNIRGIVIQQSESKYLVDFSKSEEAVKALDLKDPKLVDKDQCVVLK